jgi:hypothetical protein
MSEASNTAIGTAGGAGRGRPVVRPIPLFVAMVCLGWACAPTRAAGEPVEFQVSLTRLGPETAEDEAQGFVAALGAREGYAASLCKAQPRSWHEPPDGVLPERWVSLVAVGFRTRRDWLAFVFDGPDGAMSFAARRPATSVPLPGLRVDEMMPGAKQVSVNAVRELAADFGHGFAKRHQGGERPRVRIVVEPWRAGSAAVARGAAEPDEAFDQPEAPRDVAAHDLAGLAALAGAGAWMAGWQPVYGEAPRLLKLQVAPSVQTYAILATLSGEGKTSRCRKLDVPADDLFSHLLRVCVKLRAGDAVGDFARIAGDEARILSASPDAVVAAAEGALASWEPAAGEERWRIPAPARGSVRYVSRHTSAGELAVCQVGSDLRRVGEDGRLSVLAEAAPTFSWGFDAAPGGDVAVARETDIILFNQAKESWRHSGTVPFTAGPTFREDTIFAGSATGEMVCLSRKDGRAVWRRTVGSKLSGPVAVVDDMVLAATTGGSLVALSAADGSPAWTADIGDVLLAPPQKLKGRLVVASKANSVFMLDAASGVQKARWESRTWLTGAAVCQQGGGGSVACADIEGRIVFLDGDGLRPVSTVALGVGLAPGVVAVEKMPTRWGGGGGGIYEEAAAVLVSDRQGFIYVVPVPERQAGKEGR